ncbi:hypothetical protein F5Y10DRAFT_292190 [Nemania abortiva]|nr:hypothetical protein F5Y10DRAFT_292190 [Nemania abortiva]
MDLELLVEEDGIKEAHPEKDELSDLIFSFDSDSETGYDLLDVSLQQPRDAISLHSPSPSPPASQSGYVVISCSRERVNGGYALTETHTPGSPGWDQIISQHGKSRKRKYPSLPDDDDQADTQDSSSLHPNPPRESAERTLVPERRTLRSRQFREDMLSLLSLLPPGRYLSPSPSVSEDRFEEVDRGEYGRDDLLTQVDYTSGNCSSVSSDSSPESLQDTYSV